VRAVVQLSGTLTYRTVRAVVQLSGTLTPNLDKPCDIKLT